MRRGARPPVSRAVLLVVMVLQVAFVALRSASGQTAAPLLTVGVDVTAASSSEVTYRIVASNQGSAPATGTVLTNVVPEHTTFVRSDPPPDGAASSSGSSSCVNAGDAEPAGSICRWTIGDLPPSRSATVTMTLAISQGDEPAFAVSSKAEVTAGSVTATDTDSSLQRVRIETSKDTFVVDSDPSDTNHGGCEGLRIDQRGRSTAFVGVGPLPAEESIERVWGAQLRATAEETSYASERAGTLDVHRVVSPWSEGTGSCTGSPGTGDEARTGTLPRYEPGATASARLSGVPAILHWDVTPDVESRERRSVEAAWRIADASPTAGDEYTVLHSRSDRELGPRLFVVYTKPEEPSCIDLDPDVRTSGVDAEAELTATVTDGRKVTDSVTGADGCNGTSVRAVVDWTIEDDDPDAYFSRQNGGPLTKFVSEGRAGPNGLTSATDEAGRTSVHVRLAEPLSPSADAAASRVSARINGGPDVREKNDPDPACSVPSTPPPCRGEGDSEDDAEVRWSATSSTAAPSTSGASPSGTYARPSKRPPSPRTITISAPAPQGAAVTVGDVIQLEGRVDSSNPLCMNAGQTLDVQGRRWGQTDFVSLTGASTDHDGGFEASIVVRANVDIRVVAAEEGSCAEASSNPLPILARWLVEVEASDLHPQKGDLLTISGVALPRHQKGRAILQRQTPTGWTRVATAPLSKRSRFAFELRVGWEGERYLRVRCIPRDGDHSTGVSEPIRISTGDG